MSEDNPVSQALRDGSDQGLHDALLGRQVAILVTAREGRDVPAVLVDGSGRRVLAAFSSKATFERWGRPEIVEMVPGTELGEIAARQQVDQVLFDPAGPTPMGFAPDALQAIIDGVREAEDGDQRVFGDQELRAADPTDVALGVRATVAAALVPPDEAYLLERRVGGHRVLTVGLYAAQSHVSAVVLALNGEPRAATVDVLVLDEATRDAVRRDIPQSQVNPAP